MLPEERAIAELRDAPYAIGDEEIVALGEFFASYAGSMSESRLHPRPSCMSRSGRSWAS
jgi:hypothetical protein